MPQHVADGAHHIVFLDRETLGATLRTPAFDHTYTEFDRTLPEDVVERLRDATIVITNKVPLRADALARLPRLRLIAVAATGTDIVDKSAAAERGIAVVNVRDYAFNTVPEHVVALIFALRRKVFEYVADVRSGAWQRANQFCFLTHDMHDVAGSTLGIVGYGAIGKALAWRAEGVGMRVIKTDETPQDGLTDFATLLRESDAISLHVPLTDATRGLIGAPQLRAMKRTALLVNTARGGLVDESALAAALRSGEIAGAGIDVLSAEPPRNGNPLLDPSIPNLLVTPHVAWASREAMQFLVDRLVDNLDEFDRAGAQPA